MPVHLFIDAAKTFFFCNDVFSIEFEFTTGAVKPEGGKIKRPLPESGVDAFLTLSQHLFKDAAIHK